MAHSLPNRGGPRFYPALNKLLKVIMPNRPTRSILVTTALGLLVAGVISSTHLVSTTAAGLHKGHQKKIAAQLLEQYSAPPAGEETVKVVIQLTGGNRN